MLIGYMRISTDIDRQSFDIQKDALLKAGVDHRHIHTDMISGMSSKRPGLDGLLSVIEAGDTLVVWRLDRLGRSLSHLLQIVTMLDERGVAFRSLTEAMDTATPQGKLLYRLMGMLAEYERDIIRERIMAGLAAARRRGRIGGRPRVISDDTLDAIRANLASGMTKHAAARIYGVHRTTLIEALQRRAQ